jgi:hypothetical protein
MLQVLLPHLVMSTVAAASLPHGCTLLDGGRADDGHGPVALLIETPGLAPHALVPLVNQLELGGLDVYTLRIPTAAQRWEDLVQDAIPAAVQALPNRPRLLVGFGPGGTLAAQATLAMAQEARPAGLALLGAPLVVQPQRLFTWIAEHHTPGAPVHLGALAKSAPTWGDHSVVPLLLGAHPPALRTLSGPMADTYLGWATGGLTVDLGELSDLPVWAGAGGADALAPVESVRPGLAPNHTFVRYGKAALLRHDFDHADLIYRPRPGRELAEWAIDTLRRRGQP